MGRCIHRRPTVGTVQLTTGESAPRDGLRLSGHQFGLSRMQPMLRRYAPIKPSLGTRWPIEVVAVAYALHKGCLGPKVGMPEPCSGALEPDHIRASGAMGMKSRSTLDNCAPLCGEHHRRKTREGRTWRPLLIAEVERAMNAGCDHVDVVSQCSSCRRRLDPGLMDVTA